MKLFLVFALTGFPLLCLGATRNTGGVFEEYHAKSQSSAPLRLDDASYDQLTATPRNHSTVVLLTALEARFGCKLCRDFQPEWDLLGKSWAKGDKRGETRILLGTLDFADGKGTFQKVSQNKTYPGGVASIFNRWIQLIARPAYVTNGAHFPPIPTNHRTKRKIRQPTYSIRFHCRVSLSETFPSMWLIFAVMKPSICRANCLLDKSTSARRSQTSHTAALKLCSHSDSDDNDFRHRIFLQHCVSLHTPRHTE